MLTIHQYVSLQMIITLTWPSYIVNIYLEKIVYS